MGRLIKAKMQSYMNCQELGLEVRVLVKQGLIGVQNCYINTKGDLGTIRLQLAAASRCCFENSWWCP